MNRLAKVAALVVIVPAAWSVAASAIYCAGTGRMELFVFPYTQWLQAAPWWRYSLVVGLWVFISAALPTLALLLCAAVAFRRYRRLGRQPLYGDSTFAGAAEQRQGSIKQSRSAF